MILSLDDLPVWSDSNPSPFLSPNPYANSNSSPNFSKLNLTPNPIFDTNPTPKPNPNPISNRNPKLISTQLEAYTRVILSILTRDRKNEYFPSVREVLLQWKVFDAVMLHYDGVNRSGCVSPYRAGGSSGDSGDRVSDSDGDDDSDIDSTSDSNSDSEINIDSSSGGSSGGNSLRNRSKKGKKRISLKFEDSMFESYIASNLSTDNDYVIPNLNPNPVNNSNSYSDFNNNANFNIKIQTSTATAAIGNDNSNNGDGDGNHFRLYPISSTVASIVNNCSNP